LKADTDSGGGVAMVLPSGSHITLSGRQRISENIPTHEQLMAIKHKKKVSGDSLKFNY
jgi:c-di-GMP-binding flagellar brake protein YcgR